MERFGVIIDNLRLVASISTSFFVFFLTGLELKQASPSLLSRLNSKWMVFLPGNVMCNCDKLDSATITTRPNSAKKNKCAPMSTVV